MKESDVRPTAPLADAISIFDSGEETLYELTQPPLPSGQEGTVWRALQLGPGQPVDVAVKILDAARYLTVGALPDDVLRKWRSQAQQLRSLNHPGIAPVQVVFRVTDAPGSRDATLRGLTGLPAFVTGYVDGPSFRKWARDQGSGGASPWVGATAAERDRTLLERLDALESAAAGLDALHVEVRHAHADVKPDNIVMRRSGESVLIDFGLLRSFEHHRSGSTTFGTSNYLAPELRWGADYTAVTDLYAFAGVIFFALTGLDPPPADPVQAADILRQRTTTSRFAPLLARALHRDPSSRHGAAPSAIALLNDARRLAAPDRTARSAVKAPPPPGVVTAEDKAPIGTSPLTQASTWSRIRAAAASEATGVLVRSTGVFAVVLALLELVHLATKR